MNYSRLPFALPTLDEPLVFSLNALDERLQSLHDHRDPRGVRYPLAVVLVIAVLAKLADQERTRAVADWARLRQADLCRVFALKRVRMPHPTTWSRIFGAAVDPDELERVVGEFFAEVLAGRPRSRGSIVLAIDGKTLRGTIPLGRTCGTHLLAAYLPTEGVVLAQVEVDAKANEIVAAPRLLAQLDLRGMVVTGDALLAQRTLSAQIVEAGGDYLWIVKDNQATVLAEIETLFTPPPVAPGHAAPALDFTTAQHVEQGHGRLEERRITVSSLLKGYTDWPYLEQVCKLERMVTDSRGATTYEVRYALTSLPAAMADAACLLEQTRAHWGIENGLHYRRDVSLQEDHSLVRFGHAAHVMAILNNTVLGLLLQQGVENVAAARRAFAYHLDRALARLVT
jgi:predicted transposase YbfD/YdcC